MMPAGPQGAAGPRKGQSPPERTTFTRLSFPPNKACGADSRHTEAVTVANAPAAELPGQPSLEQLRKQAKDLRRAVLAGDQQALAGVAARYPNAHLDGRHDRARGPRDYLVAHGAPPPDLPPAEAFAAAAIGAGRARLGELLADHPGLAGEVRASRPALITWAAACGNPAVVELAAELGFDVNAKGRTDVPGDQPWQTALHKAAEDGNAELARTLLRLGADPDIRDERFDSTPLGWARHFGQQTLIELLEPVTAGTAE
jgi:Ankyrin repeats (many copies)